jgi:hypothetical protein
MNVPPQFQNGVMRLYDIDVVATGGSLGFAAWRKSFAVIDNGTSMTLVGTVSDVIAPRLDSVANAAGWDVTVTDGASLIVTITGGTSMFATKWTLNVDETINYGGF